ncbi:hypothetical protein [Limosilactobacillus fermentum]|uniref:hypothetical protein n=1 Tax=Limosilactobacillus fermentum TaxID=1613 RepID=UPI003B984E13
MQNEQINELPTDNPPINQSSVNKIMYYCFDESGNYVGFLYADKQPENSTTNAPVKPYRDESGNPIEGITVGLNNPKWNGTDWIEQAVVSKEQQLAQLALQQAQFQANQQKMNSQLALQLATLTAKGA